ncbi:molecular chaperone DnaJ [Microcella putealis]|uniref:Molecular chaperone DnaJ n=1 Tax=Microcella putealis TaxID=337005 RepID=A0A4Q7LPK8_9MICO|nr:DnaJ C-terminal domain-containing protein [Microcella putealis]RZS56172.1 molecular chaperone DnaJ [Microcella putealis]TQM23397.1 molecular chaperone DnaJ [Microcella putealis]
MASNDWFEKDFYATLGVQKDVSDAELKKVYRTLARQYHPDSNPGDAAAEARFKSISEAYAVLSDPQQRAEYDQLRAMGSGARFSAGGSPGGFEDVFGGMFGGPSRGRASQGGFEDIFGGLFGGGGGFPGGASTGFRGGPQKGRDQTAEVSLEFMTAVSGDTVTLERQGGRPLTVKVPAGVADGQKIRLKGKGEASMTGGEPGDLVLTVRVRPHPVFERDGLNLRVDVPVTFVEAALGATIEVPTLGGEPVRLKVAPGTPSGRVLRVKGRGVTSAKGTGDLLATVQVAVPSHLSAEAQKKLEAFAKTLPDENPRDDLILRARG